jgi:hypothetical protein
VVVERVLSDNGAAYTSHLWRDHCAELGITVKKIRPRRAALAGWLHQYNHTGPTQQSAANHPSPAWTTWVDITASRFLEAPRRTGVGLPGRANGITRSNGWKAALNAFAIQFGDRININR